MKEKLAQIVPATRTSLNGVEKFSYKVPEELEVCAGTVVKMPFGTRLVEGVVFGLEETEDLPERIKPIEKIVWPIPIFTKELRTLSEFIAEQYVSSLGWVVKLLLAKYAPRIDKRTIVKSKASVKERVHLTFEQKNALDKILENLGGSKTILLHGVTGSGKTEVYLDAVEKVISQGKQALILVPEIALTPQTLDRFTARFPADQVAVIHSKISYGQKSIIWREVMDNKIKVVIGPRSALFAPFAALGLVVMDEEHDTSYKQFDQSPRYHALIVAQKISKIWSCPLILSDATPSLESFYFATKNQYLYLPLLTRPNQEMPSVELIDMKQELKNGNFSIFSDRLISKIEKCLNANRQVILFLNRRGTATSYACKDCGTVVSCARCDVPLTYHAHAGMLVCHHCTRRYPVVVACAKCGSHNLKFFGTGTEKVEAEISLRFPGKKISRLDSDTVASASDLNALYQNFTSGNFDILVGTQLVARGWDLSQVGLIGVINADSMLALPDFRSNERTFQLITQVAGRAGRGKFRGHVIVQTYSPENPAIKAASEHNYETFFDTEIMDRKEFGYPPFTRIVKITFAHTKQEKAEKEARAIAEKIKALNQAETVFEVVGPAAAFISKEKGKYFFHVIIKVHLAYGQSADLPKSLVRTLRSLPSFVTVDIDPDSLL